MAKVYIDDLGGKYNTNVKPTFIEELLIKYGIKFNEQVEINLRKSGSIATGKLLDIEVPLAYQTPTGYTLEIGYPLNSKQAEYYDFVNKGVKGIGGKGAKPKQASGDYKFKTPYPSKKMTLSLLMWLRTARNKGIKETQTKRLTTIQRKNKKLAKIVDETTRKKGLAFAIGRAIKRDGLKATYFFDKAIEKVYNEGFLSELGEAYGDTITLKIIKIIGKDGNNNS